MDKSRYDELSEDEQNRLMELELAWLKGFVSAGTSILCVKTDSEVKENDKPD